MQQRIVYKVHVLSKITEESILSQLTTLDENFEIKMCIQIPLLPPQPFHGLNQPSSF